MNLYFSGNSMNNLLSYCGLTDARMSAPEKDLPVDSILPCIVPFHALFRICRLQRLILDSFLYSGAISSGQIFYPRKCATFCLSHEVTGVEACH